MYKRNFRQFVMKLEKTSEQKPLPHQEYVAQYVKAYYIPESDLENWVKYHTVSMTMNTIESIHIRNAYV